MGSTKIVVAGVGGQGTLLASRLLAESAIRVGLPVMIGETYGMAQRGGPVMGNVQIGGEPHNPQIREGDADVLLAFEPAEAVRRGVTFLKWGGLALVNTRVTAPVEVISGMIAYPEMEDLMALLGEVTDRVVSFDATALAEEAGDPIATNVVMIGALAASGVLPFGEETLLQVMKESLRPRYYELNLKALKLGKRAFEAASDSTGTSD
jgi:indolepyruvate ferredoxin oxidoreductase beta subunit